MRLSAGGSPECTTVQHYFGLNHRKSIVMCKMLVTTEMPCVCLSCNERGFLAIPLHNFKLLQTIFKSFNVKIFDIKFYFWSECIFSSLQTLFVSSFYSVCVFEGFLKYCKLFSRNCMIKIPCYQSKRQIRYVISSNVIWIYNKACIKSWKRKWDLIIRDHHLHHHLLENKAEKIDQKIK